MELRPTDGRGHELRVSAYIRMYLGDHQRQQFGQQSCRCVVFGLVVALDQDVVDPRLSPWHSRHLYRTEASGIAGIINRTGRGSQMAYKELIGGGGVTCG